MSDLSITDLLIAYGNWVNSDSCNLSCKSPSLMLIKTAPKLCAKDAAKVSKRSLVGFISDEMALAIDRAMSVLMQEYLVLYNILMLKFVRGYSDRDIAKYYLSNIEYPDSEKQVPHTAVKPLVTQGMGFVNGYLIGNKTRSIG